MITKKLIFNDNVHSLIGKGINAVADMVKITLGPRGNTVIIKENFINKITKDGWTVAKNIVMQGDDTIGAGIIKDIAQRTNTYAGDGTTTSVILAQALYNEGLTAIANTKINPFDVKRGMLEGLDDVLNEIAKHKIDVTGKNEQDYLMKVALISSNNDETIANDIVNMFTKLSKNASISIIRNKSNITEITNTKGIAIERGFSANYGITDTIKHQAILENPYVFIYDGNINNIDIIANAVNKASQDNKPLLIMAERITDAPLQVLQAAMYSNRLQSAIIGLPGYGNKRTELLKDIALIINGKVYNKLDKFDKLIPILGNADKIIIKKKNTIFSVTENTNDNEVAGRIQELNDKLSSSSSAYEHEHLRERLNILSQSVGEIKVGGNSNESIEETIDRYEDCKNTVSHALKSGIIQGGGFALFNAYINLKHITEKDDNTSFDIGKNIVIKSLIYPLKQLLINGGNDFDYEEYATYSNSKRIKEGFDFNLNKPVNNVFDYGIIDSFVVIKTALTNAVSSISTILTAKGAVVNDDTFADV